MKIPYGNIMVWQHETDSSWHAPDIQTHCEWCLTNALVEQEEQETGMCDRCREIQGEDDYEIS